MTSLLVRRGDVEARPPHAGAFRSRRWDRGLLPSAVFAALGTYCVDTDARVFSLTYDDGPDPLHTPRLLDLLAARSVRATFFVLSEPARRHPDIMRRIIADGHEVALHGWDHRAITSMPHREAIDSIRASKDVVEHITGVRVGLYRPPYGSHTVRLAVAIRRLGLELAIWSSDAVDWIDDDADAVADRAIAGIFPGAILLLHDSRADPERLAPGERLPAFDKSAVLARILDAASAERMVPVTAGQLLATHPKVKSLSRDTLFRR